MAVIKRASIPTGTLKLKRLKNDMKDVSSNRYKYVVEYPDGDQTSPRFTKQKAMTEFNRVKNNRQQSTSSSTSSKAQKAKGILGSLGFGSSKGGGEKVVEDVESGNFDPLGLEQNRGGGGSMDDLDMGISSSGGTAGSLDGLDMDLEDFD